jgi:hypothetical protein
VSSHVTIPVASAGPLAAVICEILQVEHPTAIPLPPLLRFVPALTVGCGGRIKCMTTREKLHKVVDELPDSEVEPAFELLDSRRDPLLRALDEAPEEDEEISPEEEAAAAEGRADIAAGRTVSHAEMLRKYG